jgi:hypothetical protein
LLFCCYATNKEIDIMFKTTMHKVDMDVGASDTAGGTGLNPCRHDRQRGLRAPLAALAFALLFCNAPAMAVDGRDFAAFYGYAQTADLVENQQVTFSARIFNYSGAAVTGATVTLVDSLLPSLEHGSFPGVSLPEQGSASVSGSFNVPNAEYLRWQAGSMPHLQIRYSSAGAEIRRSIELAPMMIGEQP